MSTHFNEDDLHVVKTAMRELQRLGVATSEILEFLEAPSTDLEAPAVRVKCSVRDLEFELVKSGHSGDFNLETQLVVFEEVFPTVIDGPNDRTMRDIIAWLVENAPTKIAIQRSYGRLATDSQQSQMPSWPERAAVGGTLHVYVPLFLVDEDPSSVHIYVDNSDTFVQVGEYFHTHEFVKTPLLRIPEVFAEVIVFLERVRQLDQVPSRAKWGVVNGYLDEAERTQ